MATNEQTIVQRGKQQVELSAEWGGLPNPHEVVDITQTTFWPSPPEGDISEAHRQIFEQNEASIKVAWQIFRVVAGAKRIRRRRNRNVTAGRVDEVEGDEEDDDQRSNNEDHVSQEQQGNGDNRMTEPDTDRDK